MLGGSGRSPERRTAGSTRVGEATVFLGKSISGTGNSHAKASRHRKELVCLGQKKSHPGRRWGPRECGGADCWALWPLQRSLLFCVRKGKAAEDLGLRSYSLQHTSGKDRLGHSLRRSRVPGREASVVTRMKKGSG